MEPVRRAPALCLVTAFALLLAGCGGAGSSQDRGGNQNPATPMVTVTLAANSISVAASLKATVSVSATSGTPTGSVTLGGGGYQIQSAAILSGGSAAITIPAGALAAGADILTANYSPDSASSSKYNRASGSALVSVTVASPTVTISPASTRIGTGQAISVAMAVTGFSGGAVPSGSVTLSCGGQVRLGTTLTNGSATITIPEGTLPAGNATLVASYSPDAASSAIYASASGSTSITVTPETRPTVKLSPDSQSLSTSQPLTVSVKVADQTGSGTPGGSVVLSSGGYASPAATLSGGSATITIPPYSLVYGSDLLSAVYTPDAQSAGVFGSASSAPVSVIVARAAPTITVTPASFNISPLDSLNVTVAVGGSGSPTGTGTLTLSGGGYSSPSPVTINGAGAVATIPAGALASGIVTLTASYAPDTASSSWYKPGTGTSPAVTVSTLVSIAQGTPIGTVTDQLMGMNLAAWYDVAANATPINTAFAAAGIRAIRWPGGSWSDAYHWGEGNPLVSPSMCDTNHPGSGLKAWAGPDTYPQFTTSIAKAGSYNLALTANYGSNAACTGGGDPAEAADWAAEAVKEGYPANYMTVGNEEYGSWEFDLHTKPNDPTTYANAVTGPNGYYTLIKAASPTTLVGVDVDGGGIQAGWDSTVLSLARNSYDFVEYHYYPQQPGNENDDYLVHQAAQDFTTLIVKLRTELSIAGVPSTPIYVGEMGSVFSNPGKQSWSITQGLYTGQMLGEMMNDGIARATWWIGFGNCNESSTGTALGNMSTSLYGWQTFGAYNVFSDGPTDGPCATGSGAIGTMSPTARAFQLFSNIAQSGANHPEVVLNTSVTGDTTNIRAYGATNNGGTALLLFNLNENQSEPVTITLSRQNASSSDVKVITYDKALYDKTNAAAPVWADPATSDMGQQNLPLRLTLTPWSINVVIIK